MGRTEEQGAIVTLQSKENPAVGMAGHLLLTPGIWDLACLRSHAAGGEEERVGGGGGGQVGSCGRSLDAAFACTAPALLGEVQQVAVQPAQAHRKSWKAPGTMLGMPWAGIYLRSAPSSRPPRAFTGTGHGLGVLRIIPPRPSTL